MFKFLFLLAFLYFINCQLSEYTIGNEIEESTTTNKYYMVALDQQTLQNNTLVIYIKPSDDYEGYSDPDLYASTKNYYPNTYATSEWRSTYLSNDIITIPSSELNGTHLYIGIVCPNTCKYIIKIEYQDEVEVFLGTGMLINLGNDTNAVLRYAHKPESSKIVELFSISSNNSDFEIKVSYYVGDWLNHDLFVYTTWMNGYSSIIDTGIYLDCPSCYFKIIVTGKPQNRVILGLRSANSTAKLSPIRSYFGSLLGNMMDCYLFNETRLEGSSDNFIFHGTSYRNYVSLSVRSSDLPTPTHIVTSKAFNYALTARFTYDEIYGKYLCLSGEEKSFNFNSYKFLIFREDNIEELYAFYIFSGITQQGFLLSGKATSYRFYTTIDSYKSITMNLEVNKGNPVMYAYFCNAIRCKFSGQTIKDEVNLIKSPNVNGEYHLQIASETNRCNSLPGSCHTEMVVHCDSTEECEYHVTMTLEKDELYVLERYNYLTVDKK
jgi:hypothetical protein